MPVSCDFTRRVARGTRACCTTMKMIVVEEGVRTELELPGPVITVGRALDNDIRLSNTRVSRHHSRIEAREGAAWVIDLGSANGTLVNGERVTRKLLAGGDESELCGTRLVVASASAGCLTLT